MDIWSDMAFEVPHRNHYEQLVAPNIIYGNTQGSASSERGSVSLRHAL